MAEQVEGLEELIANFEAAIRAAMGQPVVQAGIAGAEIIAELANQNAPGPHNVIVIRVANQSNALFYVGPDKEHWYYRLLETGVQPHEIGPNVMKALAGKLDHPVSRPIQHPGFPARPFLRLALDEGREKVLDEMSQTFWQLISEAIR